MSKFIVFSSVLASVFVTFTSFGASASCSATRASADPSVKGHVFFTPGETCVENGKETTCAAAHEKLIDTCKSKAIVTKYSCHDDEPQATDMPCPAGSSCNEGKCQ